MRRSILFLSFLCLHFAARGQTNYEYRYWFDGDDQTAQFGSSELPVWVFDADVNGLNGNIHTIHVQVKDAIDRWSQPVMRYFVRTNTLSDINDSDPLYLHFSIDDAQQPFYSEAYTGQPIRLDVSEIPDGFHFLHVVAENSKLYADKSSMFFKTPQTVGVEYLTGVCYVDGNLKGTKRLRPDSNGVLSWELDVNSLSQGLHTVSVQIITPTGATSAMEQRFFYRVPTTTEINSMQLYYNLDGGESHLLEGGHVNGLYHFDIDVSSLSYGLHQINYVVVDAQKEAVHSRSSLFFVNGNNLKKYVYWINEHSDEATEVEIAGQSDILNIISLLPVDTQPLRSSCFHFEMSNNKPVIYAKNDFHFRVHDVSDHFTEMTKQYVDYQVSQEVEPVGVLKATQQFSRVMDGDIRWYTFHSEEGDTVAFRLSQPATLQVFAPSGKEVFKTLWAESVKWDGIHTWEDGTYYVAVHDVTGERNDMTLNYMHMDKYDVVDWDVHTVGNGGCSTITFSGNGFKDLYAVELYNTLGDSIHHVVIGHESDASTSVTFDFNGAALGKYSAVFHFSEEDKKFSNLLTVEEAVDIELATTVSYPSVFLRGTSTTYTVKITNKGNMTAYNVPIYTFIRNPSKNGISYIKYEGLNLPGLYDGIDRIVLSSSDINELFLYAKSLGDDAYFNKAWVFDEEMNDSVMVRSNYFFKNIPPNTSIILSLEILSNERVEAWFTIPDIWPSFGNEEHISASTRRSSKALTVAKDFYCCYIESINCALDISSIAFDEISVGAGLATLHLSYTAPEAAPEAFMASLTAGIMGCATSVASDGIRSFTESICGSNDKGKFDRIKDGLKGALKTTLSYDNVLGCVSNFLSAYADIIPVKVIKNILNTTASLISANSIYKDAKTMSSDNFSCKSMLRRKPGCPPNPPGGGASNPVNSLDPNDIFGYTSESGSKYIAESVQKVNYTIEFENEPEFATASAHTVVVKDTLDSNLFDLASYRPTAVKIGDKKVDLDGNQTFVTTVDMRPSIDAIAQVEGQYDAKKGIATWSFTSLDPMSMEPSDDVMQGFLPVNYNGTSGIGEVMFDIDLKQKFPNGKEIPNRAGIVFDNNATIMTPTWTNTVDAVAPTSHVSACEIKNDTTATLRFEGTDNLSGVWKYDVYVQYEEGASWLKAAEGVTTPQCDVRIYEGINHGFYVVATDSAGNVETKEAAREYTLDLFESTEDSDLLLTLAKGWNWMSHNLNVSLDVSTVKAGALRILGQEEETMKDIALGFVGDLTELKPAQGYKIQMEEADEIALSGKLYNLSFKSISLAEGWNWIGYPLAHTMTIAQALEHFTPEEGDYIVGQSGFAQYADGEWLGTITTLNPGKGYLYKSGSRKQMFFNSTATLSSRVEAKARRIADQNPWICDMYRYPNVMPVTASLYSKGVAEVADDYFVAAFCGNECRGVGKTVKGLVMMSVYGEGGETITFKVIDKETDQLLDVAESVAFSGDVLGSFSEPYRLTIGGEATGVIDLAANAMKITPAVIRDKMTVTVGSERINRLTVVSAGGAVVGDWKKLPDGSTVDVSGLSAGVYVVTAKVGKQMLTKKVMKVTE